MAEKNENTRISGNSSNRVLLSDRFGTDVWIGGSSKPGIHIVGATGKDAGEPPHARARIAQRGG
jgi:hypothetical protein